MPSRRRALDSRRQPVHHVGLRFRRPRGVVEGGTARLAARRRGLDAEDWEALPARIGAAGSSPQDHVEERALLDAVREAVSTHLTPHQRRVFVAVVVNGSPLDAVTAALDTNRNAIYKTVFEARRRIRGHLESCGLLPPGGTR